MPNRGAFCFEKVFQSGRIKRNFRARKSKKMTSLMKMRSTLKVPKCIAKCVLAIICSNSFSQCKVDQKKTVAISQLFNHVQLNVRRIDSLNTVIYRYAYLSPTVIYCDQDRYVMKLFNLEMDSTVCKSGVFLTKFGHKLHISLSAQPDYCDSTGK